MSISIAFQEPALNAYVQCSVLLPKRKLELCPQQFTRLLGQLSETFGGYTIAGEAFGGWTDQSSGIQHTDTHLVILVAIPSQQARLLALTDLLAKAARELGELCIFLSVAGSATFFVWSAASEGSPKEAMERTPRSEAA